MPTENRSSNTEGVRKKATNHHAWVGHGYAGDNTCIKCGANDLDDDVDMKGECPVVPARPSFSWHPVTQPGQIQQDDWLSFTVAGRIICAQARSIIGPGSAGEEIVYNRQKNHYFVTSMAVDGTSTHKNVLVAKAKP